MRNVFPFRFLNILPQVFPPVNLLPRKSPIRVSFSFEATGLIRAEAMDPFHEVKALACPLPNTTFGVIVSTHTNAAWESTII